MGRTVYLDRSSLRVIYDIPSVTDTHDTCMVDNHWRMEEKGLVCLDCSDEKEAEVSIEVDESNVSVKVEVN